ncbi:divergent PAP2 family protein [Candidatus Peregrinibacteria bacterium]|nr:MAG: divergent PAP2 family protein [Candidatus Peregrinibacteria bacterium]
MEFFREYPISIPFVAILAAEIAKAMVDLFRQRHKIRFINTGGMPSGHSSFVSALVVVVAYREGLQSTAFMTSAVVALVVMYDAINVRNEAGQHAYWLNKLMPKAKLEESLGHTHIEVIVGALFGATVAFILLTV